MGIQSHVLLNVSLGFALAAFVNASPSASRPPAFSNGCTFPKFASGQFVPTAQGPLSKIAADFTNDGITDFVVGGTELTVYVGSASGTFQATVVYPDTAIPVLSGDFNGDGRIDLIVLTSNGTKTFLGDGTGGFSVIPVVGGGPYSFKLFATGDLNGDGMLDFVVLGENPPDDAISVFLGDGAGGFTALPARAAGFFAVGLVVADVNSDGHADVAVVDSSGLDIFLGDGTGALPTRNTIAAPGSMSLAVGDFNGDGRTDLVVGLGSGALTVLVADGSGGFASSTVALLRQASAIVAADFDGDGNLDIAVFSNADLTLVRGDGAGHFAVAPMRTAIRAFFQSVGKGDFNEDGAPDLFISTYLGITILRNDRVGGFDGPSIYPAGPQPFAAATADFDGDGHPDIATANPSTHEVSILLGDGTGRLGPATRFAASLAPTSLAVGDFNRDGKMDVVAAGFGGMTLSILLGEGTGRLGAPALFPAGPSPLAVAVHDLNGDGKLDLVVSNATSTTVSVLLGDGNGSFGPPVAYEAATQPAGLAIGDFDEDGIPDLAVAVGNASVFLVLPGRGDGTFGAPIPGPTAGSGSTIATGDFNGDGHLDLAIGAGSTVVFVFLGRGDGRFDAAGQYGIAQLPTDVQVGDVNGDGRLDILVPDNFNENLRVLLGDGTGHFVEVVDLPSGSSPNALVLVDLNGDGRTDVVIGAGASDGVTVLLNTTFTVLPVSLPGAVKGHAYTATFESVGGAAPIGWSMSGALPEGLIFDPATRTISGTPVAQGRFPLDITATDASGCAAVRHAVLEVLLPVTVSLQVSPTVPTVGQPWTLTATVTSQGNGIPTGTVTFTVDGIDRTPPVPLINGIAVLVIPALPPGAHTITARYNGDGTFVVATSAPVTPQAGSAVPTLGSTGFLILAVALAALGALRLREGA